MLHLQGVSLRTCCTSKSVYVLQAASLLLIRKCSTHYSTSLGELPRKVTSFELPTKFLFCYQFWRQKIGLKMDVQEITNLQCCSPIKEDLQGLPEVIHDSAT